MAPFDGSRLVSLQYANNSPFGLRQFALRQLHFAKSGYQKTPNFDFRTLPRQLKR